MPQSAHMLALAIPGYLRLGRWHMQLSGLFSTVAILAALWLSQYTARLAGLASQLLWDAGWFAVVVAYVVSRLLLAAENWHAFLRFPLMFLALPSLTYGGMAITGLVLLMHLRSRHVSILTALDAWAPCAALAAAIPSVGHAAEGADLGMPTRLPWGVIAPGESALGRLHPVALYSAIIWFAVCVLALACLRRKPRHGMVAAQTLIVGGLAAFLLDMLRQPVDRFSRAWLDPEQWVALAAIVAGAAILFITNLQAGPRA